MWTNYHTHSAYCDGKKPLLEIVHHALSKQLLALGFSSHAPLPFESPWCMKTKSVPAYLEEIKQLKSTHNDIELYAGMEVDYIPNVIRPSHFKTHLDYTIGSIHFVEQFDDGRRWEIDGTHSFFLEGLNHIFKNDIKAAIIRYLELTREMVEKDCPDVVGHLDKIKIQNTNEQFYTESEPWYQQEIMKTLKVIQKSGAIIEVNTRGIYQQKCATTYPGPEVLQRIYEMQIPITLSSDAHHPDDLVNHFPQTAITLLKVGFKKISILTEGKWKQVPFDQNGINS